MKCNIDARGKRTRLIAGIVTVAAGGIAFLVIGPGPVGTVIGVSSLVGGGFMIFEGWAGWCAVRALGFKTPL